MKALFAGSFHPPTLGHIDLIKEASGMFEGVIVAIMINAEKKYTISAEMRKQMLEKCLSEYKNVTVVIGTGLTCALAKELGAGVLVRGLRDSSDFDYEKRIADLNRRQTGIETVFIPSKPEYACIASSFVTDIARHGGKITDMVPEQIEQDILTAITKGV